MKRTIRTISVAIIGALALPVASFAKENEKEEETTVNMSDLPAEVQKTIKEKAGSSEIVRIEKETEKGKEVYEAVIKRTARNGESKWMPTASISANTTNRESIRKKAKSTKADRDLLLRCDASAAN